jgi:hypothetical protein
MVRVAPATGFTVTVAGPAMTTRLITSGTIPSLVLMI